MQHRKSLIVLMAVVAWSLSVSPDTSAARLDQASYPYPYHDPYVATMTVAILKGRESLPDGDIVDRHLKILAGRDEAYLLEGMAELRYRFYRQRGSAPLIFVVPGVGSTAYAGSAAYMAELLAGHGFHVAILPSPFSWNFTLAASATGFPGLTGEDSKDLYAAMQRVLGDIKERYDAKIGKIGMLGLSHGALYTAYISRIDSIQRGIGIDTYLLVNPPVDLLAAIAKIDEMADLGRDFKGAQKSNLEDYAFGTAVDAMRKDTETPGYFADWDNRLRLTDKQMKYLIGKVFRAAVGDTLYVIEQVYRLGRLKTPVDWGYRSGRLEEAREYPVMEYITTWLIPRLRQVGYRSMGLEALNERTSLKGVATALAGNDKVFLMHNRDDFLVSPEDLEYLEGIFGERAKIYPHGGHLGNLWYPVNKHDIVDVFQPMQGAP